MDTLLCPEGFVLVYVPHLNTTVCVPAETANVYRDWMHQLARSKGFGWLRELRAGAQMWDELEEDPDRRPWVWDLPEGP